MLKKLSASLCLLVVVVCCIFTVGCGSSSNDSNSNSCSITIVGSAGSSRGTEYAYFSPALRADTVFLSGLKLYVYDEFSKEIISIDDVTSVTGEGRAYFTKVYANVFGKDLRFEFKQGENTVVKAYKTVSDTNLTIDVNCDSTALSRIFETIKANLGSSFNYSVFERSLANANISITTASLANLSSGLQSYLINAANGTKALNLIYSDATIANLVEQTLEAQSKITDEANKIMNSGSSTSEDIKSQFLPSSLQGLSWAKVTAQNVDSIVGNLNGGEIWLIQDSICYNGIWYKWTIGEQGSNSQEQYVPYIYLMSSGIVRKMDYNSSSLNDNKVIALSHSDTFSNAFINVDSIKENGGLSNYISVNEMTFSLDYNSSVIAFGEKTKHIRLASDSFNTYVIIYDNQSAAGTWIYKATSVYK